MAIPKLFRNPKAYDAFVEGYDYPSLENIGLGGIERVKVEMVDTPRTLAPLRQQIDEQFAQVVEARRVQLIEEGLSGKELQRKLPYSSPGYGILAGFDSRTGEIPGVRKEGNLLVVEMFQSDYATRRFAGNPDNLVGLDHTTVADLKRIATPGSCALLRGYDNRILFGTKATGGITTDFEELVPQGLSELDGDPNTGEGLFYATLMRELRGETTLTEEDVVSAIPFMMSIGPAWGDFALVYNVTLREGAERRARIGREDEHSAFTWRTDAEAAALPMYDVNPTSYAILGGAGIK